MAHHKRRRPKNRRAGCLLCKPHKGNGQSIAKAQGGGLRRSWKQEWAARRREREQLEESGLRACPRLRFDP